MLHPQARAALDLWAAGPQVTDPGFGPAGIAAMRAAAVAAAQQEQKEPVARVEDVDADGVRCRLYVPTDASLHAVVVFLHGGGFVFGDLDTHDGQSRRIANRTGFAVLAVDYRRPPEHRFPAAPDDVDTVLRWLETDGHAHGLDTNAITVLGDSAGGNLALVAALRNPGLFSATVLVYPFLDPDVSRSTYDPVDGGLTRAEAQWYWEQYGGPADDPDLAPLLSRRRRFTRILEPVLVIAAEHDPLIEENHRLERRLRSVGVDVQLSTYPGMVHGFWRHPALFDAAEESLAEIADFLRRAV